MQLLLWDTGGKRTAGLLYMEKSEQALNACSDFGGGGES